MLSPEVEDCLLTISMTRPWHGLLPLLYRTKDGEEGDVPVATLANLLILS